MEHLAFQSMSSNVRHVCQPRSVFAPFWLPVCKREQKFPSCNKGTSILARGRGSGSHSPQGLCANSLQLCHKHASCLLSPASHPDPHPQGEEEALATIHYLGISCNPLLLRGRYWLWRHFWGPLPAPRQSGQTYPVT